MKKATVYLIAAVFLFPLALSSCKKADPNAERPDFIRVYADPGSETPLVSANLPVKGGTTTLYIKSSVPFAAKWQDGNVPAWARMSGPDQIADGVWKVSITADRLSEDAIYERRSGVLMLTAPEISLGNFFVLNQGLTARIACDFSWLNGGANPNETFNDVLMANWNNSQKSKGYTSNVIEGQEYAWVYSKAGYIKLGNNEGYGADLITPHTGAFQNDSLLVVSFKAVVQNGPSIGDFYGETEDITGDTDVPTPGPGPGPGPGPDPGPDPETGSSGTEAITSMAPMPVRSYAPAATDVDDNTLTIQLTGGGVFRDTQTTYLVFKDVPTYDRNSPNFPEDIFKNSGYLLFIASTPNNPISANTTLRIMAGSMTLSPARQCSRIFIDDLYVYRVNPKVDEDFYVLNGSQSGRDKVLGGATE